MLWWATRRWCVDDARWILPHQKRLATIKSDETTKTSASEWELNLLLGSSNVVAIGNNTSVIIPLEEISSYGNCSIEQPWESISDCGTFD